MSDALSENEITETAPTAPTDRAPHTRNLIWLWISIALVLGGSAGWLLGRQSGLEAGRSLALDSGNTVATAASAADATSPILPETDADERVAGAGAPVPAAKQADKISAEAAVAAGPTPAGIRPQASRTLGDPDAPVTIVEFSDYQCPFCRRHALETMPRLVAEFIDTGRVYYVFKDFPIASLHPLAYRLHEAAFCLTEYDDPALYWTAHDLFFERADDFSVETLEAMDEAILARFQDANLPDISRCLSNNTFAEAVQSDLEEGLSLGIDGTPGFFINGYPISGAQPYELFEYAIGLAESGELQAAYRQSAQEPSQTAVEETVEAARPRDVPVDDDPTMGNPDAPITIVEYSDYQCPFCRRHFLETMPQLQSYIDDGKVRYVFKDFPITSIHPQAPKAHQAARCAREIGGDEMYWLMHDLLFQNQEAWSQAPTPTHIEEIKRLAVDAQLPQEPFDDCLNSNRYAEAVEAQVNEGRQLGVNGTPAFFINGRPVFGAQPFSVFQQIIEQLLATG